MFAMERIFNIMSVIFIFYLGKLEIPSLEIFLPCLNETGMSFLKRSKIVKNY